MPIDGVEVAGARETVPAFQLGSGREALAPLYTAALEDCAAGAGRHPRAESVPALPASNVRLEGAFHEEEGGRSAPACAGHRASIEKGAPRTGLDASRDSPPGAAFANCARRENPQAESRMAWSVQPPFHSCGDCCGKAGNSCSTCVFPARSRMFSSVERPQPRCYDRRFPESGGGSINQACNVMLN